MHPRRAASQSRFLSSLGLETVLPTKDLKEREGPGNGMQMDGSLPLSPGALGGLGSSDQHLFFKQYVRSRSRRGRREE